MRISDDGQVTLSKHILDQADLAPGAEVAVEVIDGVVRLKKVAPEAEPLSRGEALVAALRGSGDWGGMTTEEIMDMVRGPSADEEIAALEKKRDGSR